MNWKRNLLSLSLGTLLLGFLSGCGNDNLREAEKPEEEKGKCKVEECIKQIEVTNSLEELNEIIGFEAEKSNYSETYTWKLNSKTSIILSYAGDSPILQATLDKEAIKSDQVDFSKYSEMSASLKSGKSFTYEEVVEIVGGVEGVLAGKTSTSVRYTWVDKHDRTFSATFSTNANGKCTVMSMR